MNKEIQTIIGKLQNVIDGDPWFGRSFNAILNEVDPSKAFQKPNKNSHSLADLLWHLITWSEFTLKSLEKAGREEIFAIEKLDWRAIDPNVHSWKKGLAEFKSVNEKIVQRLQTINDDILKETVNFRKYNFESLLYGHIEHIIYHLGQIAYVKKLLTV